MFALAIWDEARKQVFLARDRLGIKPLYYSVVSSGTGVSPVNGLHGQDARATFVFGSEIRALIATGLIDTKLDVTALDTFLMFGAVQDPLTIVEGVKSLPAAHTLTLKADGAIELNEYWDVHEDLLGTTGTSFLPAVANGAKLDNTQSEQLRDTLAEAVRLRLISDVPLGVFLSGGIDSSAVAMLAQAGSDDPVKTFTIGFEEASFDEGELARETARQLGVEHHPIVLTEAAMFASCADAVAALDQPSIDGVNTFHVSRAVKNAGMTVALSGLGGDEVFCGYEHFRTLPRREHLIERWSQMPFMFRRVASSLIPNGNNRTAKLRALVLGEYGFSHPYFLARTLFLPDQISSLLSPDAVGRIDYGEWGARMKMILQRSRAFDPVNRLSYLELKTYIANTLLRDTDVMSMAHTLEVRVPLLDHKLVEQVLSLPGRAKFSGATAKPLLVSSLPKPLPRNVTSGPKRGFVLPYEKWLKGALRPRIEESLRNQPRVLEGVMRASAVDDVWKTFLEGRTSWSRPWAMFVLNEVTRRVFDSQPVGRMQDRVEVVAAPAHDEPGVVSLR